MVTVLTDSIQYKYSYRSKEDLYDAAKKDLKIINEKLELMDCSPWRISSIIENSKDGTYDVVFTRFVTVG